MLTSQVHGEFSDMWVVERFFDTIFRGRLDLHIRLDEQRLRRRALLKMDSNPCINCEVTQSYEYARRGQRIRAESGRRGKYISIVHLVFPVYPFRILNGN